VGMEKEGWDGEKEVGRENEGWGGEEEEGVKALYSRKKLMTGKLCYEMLEAPHCRKEREQKVYCILYSYMRQSKSAVKLNNYS
jgi:hypothetical protein